MLADPSPAAERWLALALRAARMVAWTVSLPDRTIRFSDGAAEFFGTPPDQLDGGWRHVDPHDAPRLRMAAARAIRDATEYLEVVRYRSPGAPLRWLEVRGSVQHDGDGRPVALHGVTWDITAHHVAEHAARVNEENFARAFAASPEALTITRLVDGCVLEVNRSFLELYRATREQVIGRCTTELGIFTSEHDRARAIAAARDGHGQARDLPFTVRRLDGELRDVLASVVTIEIAGERCLLTSQRDVTERRQVELALRRSEDEFRTFFELCASGSALADPATGRFVRVNRRFCEITGYSAEELQSMTPIDLTHPEDRPGSPALQGPAMRGQADRFEVDKRYVRRDGQTVWVHVAGRMLTDDDGRPYRVVASIVDVTARRQAEEQLRAADRRKDEFLATLAHELRNPLAPIRYAARVLRADAPAANLATARETIERQAAHMARLLDDLLDVSRITRNVVELRRETLDLRRTIAEVVAASRPMVEAAQHRLALELPDDAVWVTGDATRLAQVVDNLLQNAVKYTDAGGRLGVALTSAAGEAVIGVTDSGIGIPRERLDDVFALFAQVHARDPERRSGLGIGLAVVKRLVELHGGRLTAASDGPGRGSTFTVRLPLAEAPPVPRPTGSTADPYPVRPRVLLVDDHDDIVASLAALLQLEGYPVHTAADGPSALRAAAATRPEVVVLDVGLPGMSGHDVARALRAAPGGAALLLIAVTGWGQAEDRRQSQDAGFDLHLTKPVDPDELLRLIAAVPRPAPLAAPAG